LNLSGTFDFFSVHLIFPNMITHQPQIAITTFPAPTTFPSAPIEAVLMLTTLMRLVRLTRMPRRGLRPAGVAGGSYVGTSTKRVMSEQAMRPRERVRQRKDSRGVSES
jgi:hypothetical protein